MISFLLSIVALVLGYFIYSKVAEKAFGVDNNIKTPAVRLAEMDSNLYGSCIHNLYFDSPRRL